MSSGSSITKPVKEKPFRIILPHEKQRNSGVNGIRKWMGPGCFLTFQLETPKMWGNFIRDNEQLVICIQLWTWEKLLQPSSITSNTHISQYQDMMR